MKLRYVLLIVLVLSIQSLLGQELLWTATEGSGLSGDVVMDNEGNVYVTGYRNPFPNENIRTVKYNAATGSRDWADNFPQRSFANSICLDSDGHVYVAGWVEVDSYLNLIVIKYDGSNGNRLKVNDDLIQEPSKFEYWIAVDNNNGVYVASDSSSDFWLVKFWADDLSIAWRRRIDMGHGEVWRGMVLDASGNIYVAGTQQIGWHEHVFTAKYLPDGTREWLSEYYISGAETEGCDGIDIDNDGNVYVCGTSRVGTIFGHPIILKYNNSGEWQWTYHYFSEQSTGCEDIKVHRPSGESYITRDELIGNDDDVYVHAVDSAGNLHWASTYGGNHGDIGRELGVTENCVYVGGAYGTPSGSDFLTLCYLRENGALQWAETVDHGSCSDIAVQTIDGGDVYIVPTGRGSGWITLKYYYCEKIMTNDPMALAYNGNRHLVRNPNSEELHLVHTREGEVIYRYSSNGGNDWSEPEIIGEGKFPAVALDSDHLPSVTWTDDEGGLWYRRQTQPEEEWSDLCHLYNPTGFFPLRLNSPPSIAIINSEEPNIAHILVTRTGGIPSNGVEHRVEDYSFFITEPENGTFELIEQCTGPLDPPLRSFPSIARCDVDNSLHAVWQRSDTICYATKPLNRRWDNWGPEFEYDGLQSAHPFLETYGDMIYVVWQHKETPTAPEEVYNGWRHLPGSFYWEPFSLTPNTKSLYSVNASGFFTVFVDEPWPPVNSNYEIYYKVEPDDPLVNISQTEAKSIYPQSAARFFPTYKYLYTAWLDGNDSPYEIRFKKIRYEEPPCTLDVAYLSSPNGHNPSSPYLIARDSFISDWQIPVDIGYETITYQFPLQPDYQYKLRAVAYHECQDKWKMKFTIDGEEVGEMEYDAYEPEILELWISETFYADSVIEVNFDCDDGDFASVGPIYVYQYEYEEGEGGAGGGPMAQGNQPLNTMSFLSVPNPFTKTLSIKLQNQTEKVISVRIYDVVGRLVKALYKGFLSGQSMLTWNGTDDNGRLVPHGIYFLRVENVDSGETSCMKVLKVK